MRRPHVVAAAIVLLLVAACGGDDGGWTRIDVAALSAEQQAQRSRGLAAKEQLFGGLVGRLTQAMADGPAQAIQVCRVEAPTITQAVNDEHGLRIGRTSHRLRNPGNAPPAWARPYVARQGNTPVWLAHDDGRLAGLLPIPTLGACLACHGPWAEIQPPVRKALAEHYPQDRAYGFRAGDLRGWFWLEIPAPAEGPR